MGTIGGVRKRAPGWGLFELRTLQVIRLRHASESLTCRYPSSLLWEDSHEASQLIRFVGQNVSAFVGLV